MGKKHASQYANFGSLPEQQKVAQDFAMSDFSPILVLQIKICITPDRHGKGSNKI